MANGNTIAWNIFVLSPYKKDKLVWNGILSMVLFRYSLYNKCIFVLFEVHKISSSNHCSKTKSKSIDPPNFIEISHSLAQVKTRNGQCPQTRFLTQLFVTKALFVYNEYKMIVNAAKVPVAIHTYTHSHLDII